MAATADPVPVRRRKLRRFMPLISFCIENLLEEQWDHKW